MPEACLLDHRVRLQVRQMDKLPPNKTELSRARYFLHCVILEQRAATEELKASNRELERLLEEVLASRSDLRSIAGEDVPDDAPAPPPPPEPLDRNAAQLKREA